MTSLRVDGWLGAFDTFSTLTVAGVDEALRAYEKSRLRQSHVTTIGEPWSIYKYLCSFVDG